MQESPIPCHQSRQQVAPLHHHAHLAAAKGATGARLGAGAGAEVAAGVGVVAMRDGAEVMRDGAAGVGEGAGSAAKAAVSRRVPSNQSINFE
jgi:hypothetical protein